MKKIELPYITLADLCSRLALLLHSGVNIDTGLSIIAEEENDPEYVKILLELSQSMEEGVSFADALESSGCFSSHIVGMIRVAEKVGRTEETLKSLADYYESRDRLSRNLRNALTYPSILLLIMLIIIVLLISKVLPVFNEVYASFGGSLSGITGTLVSFGNTLNAALPFIGICVGSVSVIVAIICLIPGTSRTFKRIFVRSFGDKGVMRKTNNAMFVNALSIAMASGLPIEEGIELAANLFSDCPAASHRCRRCQMLIKDGTDLVSALRKTDFLSPSSCRILSVGIRSGNTDSVIEQIASRMADDAEDKLLSIVARIEPALVIITSVLVGIIIISILLPLINIMETIG
jgi:type IV pilus assembly protein PilC